MINSKQELYNQCDMLCGNINRMCVTDDFKELVSMYSYSIRRLNDIFEFNKKQLFEKELNKNENSERIL